MRDPKDCDAVFKTGLILCNMLLREDGFHYIGDWESDWLETDYGKDTQRVDEASAAAGWVTTTPWNSSASRHVDWHSLWTEYVPLESCTHW